MTRVYDGGLQLSKVVSKDAERKQYVVTVTLSHGGTVPIHVNYADVLPGGVKLGEGQLGQVFRMQPGATYSWQYTFSGETTPEARLTDPDVVVYIQEATQ